MMTLNIRIYDTEENAQAAVAALTEAGFTENSVFLPSSFKGKLKGKQKASVEAAVQAGTLPGRNVLLYCKTLKEGRPLVSVRVPFGSGMRANAILDGSDGVDGETLQRHAPSDPAPLSSSIGIPTLSGSRPVTILADSAWSMSSMFGLRLLGKRAAPLSSLFGMKTLAAGKQGKTSSFGMALLSGKAAPLSSLIGLTTVLKPKQSRKSSFGLPMLSNNPAPLSNLFGMSILSKRGK